MRVQAFAGALWRGLVRRPVEQFLHRARRRAALRQVTGRQGVRCILFVCHGNMCRSPYAEGAFRRLLSLNSVPHLEIASAGFIRPGRPAPETAVEAAGRRGVDLTAHSSQQVDKGKVSRADLIVVMDVLQKERVRSVFGASPETVVVLSDLSPSFRDTRGIPDPLDQPLETFEEVYGQIDDCLAALQRALMPGQGS